MKYKTRRLLAHKARLLAKALESDDLADEVVGPMTREMDTTLTNMLLTCHAAMEERREEREAIDRQLVEVERQVVNAKRHSTIQSYLRALPADRGRELALKLLIKGAG